MWGCESKRQPNLTHQFLMWVGSVPIWIGPDPSVDWLRYLCGWLVFPLALIVLWVVHFLNFLPFLSCFSCPFLRFFFDGSFFLWNKMNSRLF